jgi:hypothetical protein
MSIQATTKNGRLVAFCDGCNRQISKKNAPLWEIGPTYDFCENCKGQRAERVKERRRLLAAMTPEKRTEYVGLCQSAREGAVQEMRRVANRRTDDLKKLHAIVLKKEISDEGTGLIERIGELLQDEKLLKEKQESGIERFYAELFRFDH